MRTQGRAPWAGLVVVFVIAIGCSGGLVWMYESLKSIKHTVVRVNSPDAKLQEASKVAKASLPQFLDRLKHPQTGDRFAIKVRFPTPAGPEYLWVRDPKVTPDGFEGRLDQQPIAFHGHLHDIEKVKTEDVYDWIVRKADGSQAGGFTEMALGGLPG